MIVTGGCGFAATCTSFLLFGQTPHYEFAMLVAVAAVLDYHLQWLSANNIKEALQHYLFKMPVWFITAFLVSIAFIYLLRVDQLFLLGHLAVIAFLYGFGIQLGSIKIPAFRNINYIKIFLIVYVWVVLTVWLPFIGTEIELRILWIETCQRALFYLAITLPFDIRDEYTDKQQQLKTLANKLGIVKTKWLAVFSLLTASLTSLAFYEITVAFAMVCSHVICFTLVLFANKQRPMLYFTGLMDGTIIIQYILLASVLYL